jgi:hypothetical protein
MKALAARTPRFRARASKSAAFFGETAAATAVTAHMQQKPLKQLQLHRRSKSCTNNNICNSSDSAAQIAVTAEPATTVALAIGKPSILPTDCPFRYNPDSYSIL